jgi:flagellar biosynthesis anti-sigma factor FlgM
MITIDGNNIVGGPHRNFNIRQTSNKKNTSKADKNSKVFEDMVSKKENPPEEVTQSKKVINEDNMSLKTYQLSESARFIKGVMDKVSQVPDVRKEKVERLKELIRKGMYDISPSAVAKKMLDDPEVAAKLLAPIKPEED